MIERILFVEAVDPDRDYIFPGAGIGYLLTAVRKAFGPERFDLRMTPRDVEATIDAFKPDLVGISSMTATFTRAQRIARAAAERGLPVVMGGMHITLLPECLNADMRVGVLGEGEEALVELLRLAEEQGPWRDEHLARVKGICYRDATGALQITEPRPPIQNLDSVGLIPYDDLPEALEGYVLTSRGCPYRCAFCSSSHYWKRLRYHSPEHTVQAIENAARAHPGDMIWIMDDLFIADRQRVETIVRLVRERGLHERYRFSVAGARANMIDDAIVALLKTMNVAAFGFGVESGDSAVLASLKGDQITIEQNIHAIETVRRMGLIAFGYLIVGAPGETLAQARRTVDFARRHLDGQFHMSLLTPQPGTPIWDLALKKGLVTNDMEWERLNANYQWDIDNALLVNEAMTRDEVRQIHAELVAAQKRAHAGAFVREALKNPLPTARRHLLRPRESIRSLWRFWKRKRQLY